MLFGTTEEELFAARLYAFLLTTDLKDAFTNSNGGFFGFSIVDCTYGDWQRFDHRTLDDDGKLIEIPEEFKYIDHEFCHQECGVIGDDFYGHIYIPLPSGKYIQCFFED